MDFLRRLMAGRNGPDNLTYASIALALIFNVIYSFSGYLVFEVICFVLLSYAVFRIFSRNMVRRRAENAWFMGFIAPIKNWFSWKITQIRFSKTHKFFKCPGCKNILRVPRGKGKIHITCPKCGQRFDKKT